MQDLFAARTSDYLTLNYPNNIIYIYMYVCMYVCMCMYVRMYVCMYTHTDFICAYMIIYDHRIIYDHICIYK